MQFRAALCEGEVSLLKLSKMLYHRVYTISSGDGRLKNVKFMEKYFSLNSISYVDNGENIYLVIGEETAVETVKEIFGHF